LKQGIDFSRRIRKEYKNQLSRIKRDSQDPNPETRTNRTFWAIFLFFEKGKNSYGDLKKGTIKKCQR